MPQLHWDGENVLQLFSTCFKCLTSFEMIETGLFNTAFFNSCWLLMWASCRSFECLQWDNENSFFILSPHQIVGGSGANQQQAGDPLHLYHETMQNTTLPSSIQLSLKICEIPIFDRLKRLDHRLDFFPMSLFSAQRLPIFSLRLSLSHWKAWAPESESAKLNVLYAHGSFKFGQSSCLDKEPCSTRGWIC